MPTDPHPDPLASVLRMEVHTPHAIRHRLGEMGYEVRPKLTVERLAAALRTLLHIDPDDDARYDFGDMLPLSRPSEAAEAILAALAAEASE